MEAVCVHDVDEEIRKRRAEPAIKVGDKEREFIWAALGGSWAHASSRVSPRLLPPHTQVPINQGAHVERRGEDDVFLPHLHQIDLLRLCIRVDGFRRFALAHFGRHGDCGSGGQG